MVRDVAELECLPSETEILTASFPCVDVSHAGSRAGVDGQATGLVRHVFRLLAHPRSPRVQWVVLENVPGLLDRHKVDGGLPREPGIAYVVSALEKLGYSWAHRIINCAAFGIPQRRRRMFLVGSLHGDPRDVLLSCDFQCLGGCRNVFTAPCACCALTVSAQEPAGAGAAPRQLWDDEQSPGVCIDLSNAQCPPCVGLAPTFTTGNCRMAVLLGDGRFGLLRIQDAERLQGLPEGWTDPASTVCASRGVSRSREGAERRFETALRWTLLGNAVTVQVARWLGTQLARPYAHKFAVRDSQPFAVPVPLIWPRCAWAIHGEGRHGEASIGEHPCYTPFAPLAQFIGGLGPPPSGEALEVWVKRMHTAGWNLHGPLHGLAQRLSTEVQRTRELQLAAGGQGAVECCAVAFMTWRESLQPEQLAVQAYIREPRKRALVWAKQAYWPPWPALVVDAGAGDHIPAKIAARRPGEEDAVLLVMYLGDASCNWLRLAQTTDWHTGYEAHKDGGDQGTRGQRQLFLKAMGEAHMLLGQPLLLLPPPPAPPPAPEVGSPPGGLTAPTVAAPERQMATRGPGESPCQKRCKVCVKHVGGGARCIMDGVLRLAAAGHPGAMITASSVRGSSGLTGQRIGIYWPLDDRHYFARLVEFDFLSCMWRIHYEDDKFEALALWKERVSFDPTQATGPAVPGASAGDAAGAAAGAATLEQGAASPKRLCIRNE